MIKKQLIILLCCVFGISPLCGQTISEKKAGLGHYSVSVDLSPEMYAALEQANFDLEAVDKELHLLYQQAQQMYLKNACAQDYCNLLRQIQELNRVKLNFQESWREKAIQDQVEGYALWHQPSTTLEQLVMDYGAQDFVYLIPQDIGELSLSVASNLPIPRASWNEMLETILAQNGVGIKQLNPYLRQLFWLDEDRSHLALITNKRCDLDPLPNTVRVAFMLSPEPSDTRRIYSFLDRFADPQSVVLQQLGRDILIVAKVLDLKELLKLYDFIMTNRGDKEYKVVPITHVDTLEMARILNTIFGVLTEEPQEIIETAKGVKVGKGSPPPFSRDATSSSFTNQSDNGLQVIPLSELARAVFLVGSRAEIRKAEEIIREVENQVSEGHGKVIYWYTVKHSNPEELADVLYRIYTLMVAEQVDYDGTTNSTQLVADSKQQQTNIKDTINNNIQAPSPPFPPPPLRRPYEQGFFLDDSYVVNKRPPPELPLANVDRDNFIVDLKSGAIVMVVEADILPKIKDLIRKLDIPKKMVQLEVLLFEKKLSRETNFGLNLLKVGSEATNTTSTGAIFHAIPGIFEFLISREKNDRFPAFDAIYRFLLTQDDVSVNACPSVLAVNQTPALIEINEEISVNTGIYAVDTVGGVTLEDAFARARYGIRIEITPTIYTLEEEVYPDELPYVNLETDLTFQNFRPALDNRPNVTTRHIINEVRIPDRQTVILGGLRQRNTHDKIEKIPFIGELPGVGKLFSHTELRDDTTEMFILITPKIIYDPVEDLERVKMREMCLRPGDIPAFLCLVEAAHDAEKYRLFQSSLTMLLGRMPAGCICPCLEYDGR